MNTMADELSLKEARMEKIKRLKEMGINPYQYSYDKIHTIAQALNGEGKKVKTAGRLMSYREHGNIAFADLVDETGRIQVFFQKKILEDLFKNLKLLDIGDFIGVEGEVGRTVAGEISIIPTNYTILTKSLRPIPNEWYGLKDVETRYRQRYLDLLLNPKVRERFNIRTKLISGVREYLDTIGFWEVETPTLQVMYGGTNAKPFTTHLHALDQMMYLRIAVELYIKRLLVGGYEKVYEIAKDFRNEGIDNSHFPEFTMLEWYEAYVDYNTMMDRAEGLLKFLAKRLFGTTILQVDNQKIDIGKKWPRVTMNAILQEKLGLDIEKETEESLKKFLKEKCPEVHIVGSEVRGQLVFAIFDHLIPKMLIEPTWIIDYPEEISPLSRPHRNQEGRVERYEGYIGGKEIFDGWTEITEPSVQRAAWESDQKAERADKEEAQHVDEDFLTAMEYGMPPYGGIGVGIDRLTMLFTNTWTIKELILFPTLKRDKVEKMELTEPEASVILASDEGTHPESKASPKGTSPTRGLPSSEGSLSEAADVSHVKITRDEAFTLLQKYMQSPNLIKHSLAAEAAMKGIYEYLYKGKEDERAKEIWGITGLLHDIDYEVAQKEERLDEHGRLLFDRNPKLVEEPIRTAIKAHNYTKTGTDPETDLDWAISCVDQLTGLVVSSTLISPTKKMADIDADFVMRKFNKPAFSQGVDRENIRLCETKLGIPLLTFIQITLSSMRKIADKMGL